MISTLRITLIEIYGLHNLICSYLFIYTFQLQINIYILTQLIIRWYNFTTFGTETLIFLCVFMFRPLNVPSLSRSFDYDQQFAFTPHSVGHNSNSCWLFYFLSLSLSSSVSPLEWYTLGTISHFLYFCCYCWFYVFSQNLLLTYCRSCTTLE